MNTESEFIKNKVAAYTTIAIQIAVTLLVALLISITTGKVAGYSALLGGVASILPSAIFARCAYRYSAADSPSSVMRWFMIGEAVKVITTVLIFAVCLTQVKPLSMPVMFATYLLVMFVNLVGGGKLQSLQYKND